MSSSSTARTWCTHNLFDSPPSWPQRPCKWKGDTPHEEDFCRPAALALALSLAAIAEEAPAEYVINYVAAEDLAAYEDMEFDPTEEYDIWTIVEYTIEDIQADLVCTVSAKADFSEFYQECNFYGDDQMTHPTWDGETYEVLEDKTGFMAGDTPAILDIAIEHNLWVPIEKQVAIPPDAQGRSSFRPCSYMSYIKLAPSFFRKIQSNLFTA